MAEKKNLLGLKPNQIKQKSLKIFIRKIILSKYIKAVSVLVFVGICFRKKEDSSNKCTN